MDKTMRIEDLNDRSRAIFRYIVESYLETGEPVGSRTLSRMAGVSLSAASVRNVMADLEDLGLLESPHTSAGRLPSHLGLRLFVDGLLEVGDLSEVERANIESQCQARGRSPDDVLGEATQLLSGLSRCAGLVVAEKVETPVRHVEFVHLGPGRALVVVVQENGDVENRVVEVPQGLPPVALQHASNYLNARFAGRTFEEARKLIEDEISHDQAALDVLAARIVQAGLATWGGAEQDPALIVRGQANLLEDVRAIEDLERVRRLLEDLETKRDMLRLVKASRDAEGVRIFIGAENNLFSLSGSSVIVAPYMSGDDSDDPTRRKIIGVIGVIGPTRLNYARIIPMVDYTARVVGRLL
ncbi:heat-inducible transcriptional repressor HrcA [Rhodothalassium salexigens]|uniref:heat-inducible transcriptional repressor HrcA n=2 Tax=Rhodothalassium salexigens TaxID=1086 RepID=UPI0019139BB5|nr:heat-inducible transcriptional repressor HrcA [Rhodothalassium salexigens]